MLNYNRSLCRRRCAVLVRRQQLINSGTRKLSCIILYIYDTRAVYLPTHILNTGLRDKRKENNNNNKKISRTRVRACACVCPVTCAYSYILYRLEKGKIAFAHTHTRTHKHTHALARPRAYACIGTVTITHRRN